MLSASIGLERELAEGHQAAGAVSVALEVHGPSSVAELAAALGELDGVIGVAPGDVNEMFD